MVILRQSEQPLGDDVALHLRRSAVDGRGQRVLTFEQQVRIGGRLRARSGGAEFPNTLQRKRSEQLHGVGFRAGPPRQLVAQRAISGGPQGFGVGDQGAELGVDVVARDPGAGGAHRLEPAFDLDPVHDPDHLAFMLQRRQGDIPAAVERPQQVVGRHFDVVEEDLAERLVGDRRHADRLDPDPGRVQIQDQAGNAAVFRRIGIRAGIQGAPSRLVGLGGPDLVAVDPEHVAVAFGARAQPGEVGPGFGFGHAQRPPFVTA